MKISRIAILIPILFVALSIAPAPHPTQAQVALSPSCHNFAAGGFGTGGLGGAGGDYFAGEVITIKVSLGSMSFATFVIESPLGTVISGPTSAPATYTYTIPSNGHYLFVVRNLAGSEGLMTYTITCSRPSVDSPEVKFFDPGDDRLNRDPGQPAALYCRNQGDVHIYGVNIDDSKGKLALVVTKAEIDAVINGNPTTNTLIKQSADGKLKLFYLPATKELSFITTEARSGKQYSFVWKGLCR